jgi:hypothetical protein
MAHTTLRTVIAALYVVKRLLELAGIEIPVEAGAHVAGYIAAIFLSSGLADALATIHLFNVVEELLEKGHNAVRRWGCRVTAWRRK